MSRKSKVDADTIIAICEDVANGKTLTKACKERDVVPSTVRYQLMKDEELFAHSTRAREVGCDAIADECIAIADDPELDAAEKRVRIDTRIRLIGKWSQRYSDKITVENNTTVTHKYDLDSLSDEDLDTLESIALKASVTGRDKGGEGEAVSSRVH